MRDPERIHAITTALWLLWNKPENRDLRLGQLLYNLSMKYDGREDLFCIEDSDWLDYLRKGL